MTRPAQHTSASSLVTSGSAGEATAPAASAAQPGSPPEAETSPAPGAGARDNTVDPQASSEAEETATEARTPAAVSATEAAPGGRPEADADSDPSAAAEAKSRLPALVRTMTATAIDRPQQQAATVGRPGRAALAGAAVAGALLVSVPFLVLTGGDDKDAKAAAAGGTVLGGGAQEAPGDFVVTDPDTATPDHGEKSSGKPDKPVQRTTGGSAAQDSGKETAKQDDGGKDRPRDGTGRKDEPAKSGGGGKTSGGGRAEQPSNAGSGVTFSAPVSIRSHLSGRCLDVPNADFGDGKKLFVWDCNNGVAQKWQFASDGTLRIQGLCLDVANANYNDGTPIQIARCSGNAAQKFVLNERHDLVNTVVGKCVDIKDNNRGNGAWLQLWTCAGTDNQKWSV
ncbi:ricin-type beta-trefoil lectin domain protein [Streptomyces sp. NPDC059852]|uniref:ricin-type beta-trefoil lectin domain protein n=1 Tax=Streptomyces sp. NPDC059852 TaxID=3346972 RepID=UPI003653DD66